MYCLRAIEIINEMFKNKKKSNSCNYLVFGPKSADKKVLYGLALVNLIISQSNFSVFILLSSLYAVVFN